MSVTEIGRRLKHARIEAGLTQADVAKQLKVTYQAISNYERGINKVDADTLARLCGLYNIHVSQILTTPLWTDEMLKLYHEAKTDEEKQRYINQWGTPAELMEEENNRREPDLNPLSAEDEAVLYAYHHADEKDKNFFRELISHYVPISRVSASITTEDELFSLIRKLNPNGLEELKKHAGLLLLSDNYKKATLQSENVG